VWVGCRSSLSLPAFRTIKTVFAPSPSTSSDPPTSASEFRCRPCRPAAEDRLTGQYGRHGSATKPSSTHSLLAMLARRRTERRVSQHSNGAQNRRSVRRAPRAHMCRYVRADLRSVESRRPRLSESQRRSSRLRRPRAFVFTALAVRGARGAGWRGPASGAKLTAALGPALIAQRRAVGA
jgi:hypothetical protein